MQLAQSMLLRKELKNIKWSFSCVFEHQTIIHATQNNQYLFH